MEWVAWGRGRLFKRGPGAAALISPSWLCHWIDVTTIFNIILLSNVKHWHESNQGDRTVSCGYETEVSYNMHIEKIFTWTYFFRYMQKLV